MGRSSTFSCNTCRKNYFLGYGSYGSWLDLTYSLDEYEEKAKEVHEEFKSDCYNWHDKDGKCDPPDPRDFYKNENVRKCLEEHQGHDIDYYSEDFYYEEHQEYEFIDMELIE